MTTLAPKTIEDDEDLECEKVEMISKQLVFYLQRAYLKTFGEEELKSANYFSICDSIE